ENPGAFLGMGSDLSPILRTLLLLILPGIVMVAVTVYLFRNKEMSMINLWALSFIVGGGIGNLYDRILYGQVTDMIFLDFQFAHTGIFNMADVSVMVGTGLILLDQFLPKKKEEGKLQES
ncbi:MAG: signal peptidase II, partial [Roseivirga sp.]|nr:signal peptidase II [Roseivirga sp.]